MKGVVFRALMSYAEDGFGPLTLESVLARAAIPRDGAYTSVGRYPVEEFWRLVDALNAETGVPRDRILRECGRRTLAYVVANQPPLRSDGQDLEGNLASLSALIQANFVKLYPGGLVPMITVDGNDGHWLYLLYHAQPDLADLAEGVILGALDHLQIKTEIVRQVFYGAEPRAIRFRIRLPDR